MTQPQNAPLAPEALVSPGRRSVLLGAASSAFLAACGGGENGSATAYTAPATDSERAQAVPTPPYPSAAAWLEARQQAWELKLQELRNGGYVRATGLNAAAIKAAMEAAAAGSRKVLLPPGKWTLAEEWVVPVLAVPITFFSEGVLDGNFDDDTIFEGPHRIKISGSVSFYNCRFVMNSGTQIFVESTGGSGLTLMFNRFRYGTVAVDTNPVNLGAAHAINFLWNDVAGHDAGGQSYAYGLRLIDIHNSSFSHNRILMSTLIHGRARAIEHRGGYRNTFSFNYLDGGLAGICGLVSGKYPAPNESYSARSNQSHLDYTVEGNTIRNMLEESISFDCVGDQAGYTGHPGMDAFTLARYGTQYGVRRRDGRVEVLVYTTTSPSAAAPEVNASLYSNYMLMWLSGTLRGKYAQIYRCERVSDNVLAFALRSPRNENNVLKAKDDDANHDGQGDGISAELTELDVAAITNNDLVGVGPLAANLRIINNRIFTTGRAGRNTSGITLWGTGTGYEIRGNVFHSHGTEAENKSYRIMSLSHVAVLFPRELPVTVTDPQTGAPTTTWVSASHGLPKYRVMAVGRGVVTQNSFSSTTVDRPQFHLASKRYNMNYSAYGNGAGDHAVKPIPVTVKDNGLGAPVIGTWDEQDGTPKAFTLTAVA